MDLKIKNLWFHLCEIFYLVYIVLYSESHVLLYRNDKKKRTMQIWRVLNFTKY